MPQSPGGCAPVAEMVTNQQFPAVLLAGSPGPPSKIHPGNVSPTQTRSSARVSLEPNDEDPDDDPHKDQDYDEEDEEYVPGRASRRKRRRSSRSDAIQYASNSTKRMHTSNSPKLGSAGSSTMVGEDEDLVNMLVVPTSRNKSWRFTNVAYETVDASKAYHESRGADSSPSNTLPLDDGTLIPEDSNQHKNDHARSFLSKSTTHHVHGILHPSSTSKTSGQKNFENQRTGSHDVVELSNSEPSAMPTPLSQPDSGPSAQKSNDQLGSAVKPSVEYLVVASWGAQTIIMDWPSGTLKDKNANTIFDEVSTMTTRNDIQTIGFRLETWKKTPKKSWKRTSKKEKGPDFVIQRGHMAGFEVVRERLNGRMNERKKAGDARFRISLEPDPKEQSVGGVEVTSDPESDEDFL